MSEDKSREKGFEIFRAGFVRRLSHTHYIAKNAEGEGWRLIELKDGKWRCDCKSTPSECPHLYASRLLRTTCRLPSDQIDGGHLKCRYCGSVDVASSGYRFNTRGIARRYRCNECLRKFSIPYVETTGNSIPSEMAWILNEIGMLTTKLTDLLSELNLKLDTIANASNPVKLGEANLPDTHKTSG